MNKKVGEYTPEEALQLLYKGLKQKSWNMVGKAYGSLAEAIKPAAEKEA